MKFLKASSLASVLLLALGMSTAADAGRTVAKIWNVEGTTDCNHVANVWVTRGRAYGQIAAECTDPITTLQVMAVLQKEGDWSSYRARAWKTGYNTTGVYATTSHQCIGTTRSLWGMDHSASYRINQPYWRWYRVSEQYSWAGVNALNCS